MCIYEKTKKHCETNSVSDIIPERIGIFMPFYFEGLFFLKEKCNKGTFYEIVNSHSKQQKMCTECLKISKKEVRAKPSLKMRLFLCLTLWYA